MKWFRKSFVWLSAGCLGATASAQEPGGRPATTPPPNPLTDVRPAPPGISLGRSTPLSAGAAPPGIVRAAFVPIRPEPTGGGVRPASYSRTPRPTVVRASGAMLDDDPTNLYLPKDLAPVGETKLPPPILPIAGTKVKQAETTRPVSGLQPMGIKNSPSFYRVDKSVSINVLPEMADAPTANMPVVVDASISTDVPGIASGERIIIVDESGNPLFGDGMPNAPRWYGQAEWLLWWSKGFYMPPLVTTASPTDVPESTRGTLGVGSTQLLYGNGLYNGGPRSGGRFTFGHTLDPCGLCGVEATYFFLGQKNDSFVANSSQYPVLARPFYNINTGLPDREVTTSPGIAPGDLIKARGSVEVNTTSRLWGIEANARTVLWRNCQTNVTGLVGFRYLDLKEQLNITERIEALFTAPPDINFAGIRFGDRITVFDEFQTRNRFYGGQVGINAEWQRGRWTLDTRMKIAFGATHQSVDIAGGQSIASLNGQVQQFNGGLYALPSNIGHVSRTRFAVVPETGFKIGYNITDNVRIYAGYDFLYWSNVLRPGDQIDVALDTNKIPNFGGPNPPANQVRPIVPLRPSGYWAQGVSAGLEFRY